MSFGRFLCEVDVNTVIRCDGCGTDLRRSRTAFALFAALGVGFIVASVAVVRVTLRDPTGTGLVALALFFIAAPPLLLLLARYIGWKLIPWKAATQQDVRLIV